MVKFTKNGLLDSFFPDPSVELAVTVAEPFVLAVISPPALIVSTSGFELEYGEGLYARIVRQDFRIQLKGRIFLEFFGGFEINFINVNGQGAHADIVIRN